ncbi:hypothetical protein OJF2_01870 [Aquisphaera giovannonii]|uniref:Uncharacterized protein n=1 Tax=Aquisphaera giovannonii TaxID=406548 RepID=A0A5B9VTU4_9BACT|nr:hypothetical protein [Aquisphaera giovannonii]QEH31722.1 hypothetical protein OJF2_01870 [Aquisphaera giovannonii]
MSDEASRIAEAVRRRPHGFEFIRGTTGLKLTDDQFRAIVLENRGRFKLVRFLKRDDEGVFIRPGRLGVQLRGNPA